MNIITHSEHEKDFKFKSKNEILSKTTDWETVVWGTVQEGNSVLLTILTYWRYDSKVLVKRIQELFRGMVLVKQKHTLICIKY